MKIKVIQIGKNKDSYISAGIAEFLKRLQKFADVKIVELKETGVSKTFVRERAVELEGAEIIMALGEKKANEFVVVLDENGNEYDSVEFAEILACQKNAGKSLTFVIGGAFGLSTDVKERGDVVLSFSKMTFTHQMIRLILLEQIYRAFTIIAGTGYHH